MDIHKTQLRHKKIGREPCISAIKPLSTSFVLRAPKQTNLDTAYFGQTPTKCYFILGASTKLVLEDFMSITPEFFHTLTTRYIKQETQVLTKMERRNYAKIVLDIIILNMTHLICIR